MSASEDSLVCPVCRAGQPLQFTCRRCAADLQLYVKALRSLQLSQRQEAESLATADQSQLEAVQRYINWLAPRAAHD